MPSLDSSLPSKMSSDHCAQFVFRQKADIDHIFGLLNHDYSLQKTYSIHIQRQYLDSFDWRLYQKGYICGIDSHGLEHLFFLQPKKADHSIWEFPLDNPPKFPHDITHPSCQKLLNDILGIRALITVAVINIKRWEILVLNKENKTLARLYIESYSIEGQADARSIPDRLIIFPVRGYKKVFQDILHYITQHVHVSCADNTLFAEVLTVAGQTPGTSALTITQKLTDSLNAREAVQIILTYLLNVMQANEQGIRNAIDTEFLHDYRVAVRRTRSILGQIKQVFPDKVTDHFKQAFRWLGMITGPTRDLDIYLLTFDEYMRELPAGLQNDLLPFRHFLQRHWKVEHERLCKTLESSRYHKLIGEWQHALENKNFRTHTAINAEKPAKQVAHQSIWKLYKKILKEGMSITEQSRDEDLHELRKTCKKFRYLIEFFHDYYPDKQIKKALKTLKLLQANLGDFQDLSIQITQLNRFAQDMQNEGLAETKTIMAMGVLVEKLITRKQAVRAQFRACFREFTSPGKRTEFINALSFHHQSPSEGISG